MSQPLSPLNQESNNQSSLRPATSSNGARMADLNAARLRAAYLLYPNLAPHNIDMNNDDFITVSRVNMNMNDTSSIDVSDAASLHSFDTQARLRIVEGKDAPRKLASSTRGNILTIFSLGQSAGH